ncbi:glycosyltransferase family 2 protein [Flavisolibacter nicotianae]|uniref:glycosyltransferase family 2 protein n=1 Tax=Flavisolibacter nicotianae TaxID=2364882 RepID=UPI000EB11F0D|nr:glycosyltransferase family 2 protein [Flavisolibacter nicotianae]
MRVSIVLCTCNGAAYLQEQLDSFLLQTILPDELVVCDDMSTDNTMAILQEFQSRAPFHVIIRQNPVRFGPRENFQQAVTMANGDIIFLSDQDDIWTERKIAAYLALFSTEPDALLVFSNGELMDENGQSLHGTLWDKWGFDEKTREAWQSNGTAFDHLLRNNNKVTGAAVAIRSTLREKAIPFCTQTAHWHDAWLALIAAGLNGLRFINGSFIQYRVHPTQQVGLGDRLNPLKKELEKEGPAKARLRQLHFEKKISELFPEKKEFDRMRIEQEINLLKEEIVQQANPFSKLKKIFRAATFRTS